MASHSEPQNPYASVSGMQIHPDSISFDGVVDESMYLSLVPRIDKYIVLPLAFLIALVGIPISIATLVFGVFVERRWDMFVASICLLVIMSSPLVFCIRTHAMKIPLPLMKCTAPSIETLCFKLPSGSSLFLFRSHFRDTTAFDNVTNPTKD